MAAEQATGQIGDFFDLVGGYAFKSGEFINDGTPVIKIKNVKANRMLYDDLSYVAPEFLQSRSDKVVKKGDLLITMSGNRLDGSSDTWVGKVAQFKEDRPFLLNQRVGILRPKSGIELERRFFSYALSSDTYQNEFIAIATSSGGQANLSPSQILSAPLEVPPLPEQQAIAHILGTLDDKIELNRRMNATLEAMARALFQSWFVDFDPVRAKLDGRKPAGLDAATAALFPAQFQETPLGHIPQGWEVKAVGEIGNVVCGKTPSTTVSDYYGNDIPFITIPDMHGNVFAASTGRKLSHAGADSQANKTLPPGSICVSCIATPGLVVITSENSQTNQQINSVVPRQRDESYFWYWVMTGLGAEIASSGSGGSVLANLSKGRFETLQVINPPHALIRAFHSSVSPLFENILANTRQSSTLATLRDALLPKLLSGELSVAVVAEETGVVA